MDSGIISKQWASRPDDQRFISIEELHAYNLTKQQAALELGVALDHLRLQATDGDLVLADPKRNTGATFTHWSFGQLCTRIGAPAGYLRTLPPELAAIPLQWSLEQKREDAKLLMRRNGTWTIDAITSGSYGRIFDAEMTQAVIDHVDLAVWKIPVASYASSNPKRATTLYASDRDCFVCLVDDQHPITVPGKEQDTLFRGFICRNSEVGAAAYDLFLFLYRYICDNRIIWGLSDTKQFKIRHTSGGPMRFMREAKPALQKYLESGTQDTIQAVIRAQEKEIGKTEKDVSSWLKDRGFTRSQSQKIVETAQGEEGNPRSIWNLANAVTDLANDVPFGDERLALEKKAGKMLDSVI